MMTTVYMNYVMIAVLLMAALACAVAPSADMWLPGNRKYVMAGVLVVYSAVRFARLKKYKRDNANEMQR